MQNTKCLVITCGFFGDIIFASSLAEKLKYDQIDYLIGFPQVQRLIQNNPYISNVYVSQSPGPHPQHNNIDYSQYNKIIKLQSLNYQVTPCEEFQQYAEIENPSSEYKIYTQPEFDKIAEEFCNELRSTHNKPVVAVMSNWKSKTYLFTKEQYKQGIDIPPFGYGGSHRNIDSIVEELNQNFTLIPVGVGELNQLQTLNIPDEDTKSLLFEASLIKYCDAFIGTDGGLATIAAGVGTKTIITGDFNLQLYGWNGCVKKIQDPKLGPEKYFPKFGHKVLDPYLTDKEVIKEIINEIKIKIKL